MRPSLPFAAALVLALGGSATAHAFLDHADPRVGSTSAKPPAQVSLWFTEGLEPSFCQVSVSGPAGFSGAGKAHAAPGDARRLVVDLRGPAPPGTYTVRWRVMSVDTHVTSGDFSFKVAP
ncbi:MAG TPA: copper resistance CopC family protein [Caulobacteraceae bacterium]|jgi:hypothetical protein|nr:copper resistance CopC family protein [Caulobacteraceae bacterium]